MLPTPEGQPEVLLAEAARLFIASEPAAARPVLEPLSGTTIVDQPLVLRDVPPAGAYEAADGPLTHAPSLAIQAQVFARDYYTCVYCERRTIFLQVLNLLSLAFPEDLPRHPHWKKSITHRLYWDLTTSIDHVLPVSRGGEVEAIENLATVCARCQYQKNNRSLESLGWAPVRSHGGWDGLTEFYEPLWQALGKPGSVHRRWLAEIHAVGDAADGRQSNSRVG